MGFVEEIYPNLSYRIFNESLVAREIRSKLAHFSSERWFNDADVLLLRI